MDYSLPYELLKKYDTSFCEEKAFKEKMLDLLQTCDDCFLRSCRVGHFTASSILLNKDKTHVCLMHHVKLKRWLQLGGHCDGDIDFLQVAIKESCEESGIAKICPISADIFDLDIHLIPPSDMEKAHYHFDVRFLLHAYEDDKLFKNKESNDLKWVPIGELKSYFTNDRSMKRLIRKLNEIKLTKT